MVFHYGSACQKRQQELEWRNVDLERQLHEAKAMYHYQTHHLEQEISKLKAESGSRKCVLDNCEEELNKLVKENARLRQEITGLEFAGKSVFGDFVRAKDEVESLKKEYAARMSQDPVATAEREKRTGEVVHRDYTDGERTTTIDLTKPNSETIIKMDKPLKDESYLRIMKDIEKKYLGSPEDNSASSYPAKKRKKNHANN